MGNKQTGQKRILDAEEPEKPIIIDVDPKSDAIQVACINGVTMKHICTIVIPTQKPESPLIVYDTVNEVLLTSDKDYFIQAVLLKKILKCEKISSSAPGESNVVLGDYIIATQDHEEILPGKIYAVFCCKRYELITIGFHL